MDNNLIEAFGKHFCHHVTSDVCDLNINIFNNSGLIEATTGLFGQLGIPLITNTEVVLNPKEVLIEFYQDREPFTCISQLYFAGLVDDSVFERSLPCGYSYEEANSKPVGITKD